MIRLTFREGDPVYLSPENIIGIYKDEITTINTLNDGEYSVTESPEEVARKVLEYRLTFLYMQTALMRGHDDLAYMHNDILCRLAGLEEQKDE